MTSKLTREENVQAVFDLKAGYILGLAEVEILKRVARMALAAMDSEPVAEVCEDYAIRYISSGPAPKEGLHPGDKLYRHAQQPVVPDERAAFNAWNNEDNLPIAGVGAKKAAWLAWQARAELAGNSPVITDSARDALEKALAAMEFMGDTLNNLDAVCTEDVEFVAPAFDAVRNVLAAASREVKP